MRRYEERRRRGRTGKERTSPGVAKTFRRRGRRKTAEPVLLLAGLGKGVTAARPLDGGVLTRRGSAHAGEGAGGGAMDARLAPPLALVWLGSDAAEKREQGRERRERR